MTYRHPASMAIGGPRHGEHVVNSKSNSQSYTKAEAL